MGQLDNLDSYGLLDHFVQYCLFGWPVIVIWICEPEISESYFFLGPPVVLVNMVVRNLLVVKCSVSFVAGSRGASGRDVWNQESFRHQYVRKAGIILMSIIN